MLTVWRKYVAVLRIRMVTMWFLRSMLILIRFLSKVSQKCVTALVHA